MKTQQTGRAYWRSLDELADSPAYRQFLDKEFADYAPDQVVASPNRRTFMKLMGASMALAGMAGLPGCRRWPEKTLAPFAKRPAGRTPGQFEQYATLYEMGGVAQPLLVTSADGRPTKIEGNPTHPQSQGAADTYCQASVLEMYDPHRSRFLSRRVEYDRTTYGPDEQIVREGWTEFNQVIAQIQGGGGQGLAILSESTNSPSVAGLRSQLTTALPGVQWFEWEPLSRANEIEGARLAFGQAVRPVFSLDKARVIACFDADILCGHPSALRYARDWAKGRDVDAAGGMNRMYVVESHYTVTGTNADVRTVVASSQVINVLRAVAAGLGVNAGAAGELSEHTAHFVADLVKDLKANAGASVLSAGPSQPPEVHALIHLLNQTLGNAGKTIGYLEEPSQGPTAVQQIASLTQAIKSGAVKTLIILGGNPVYDAPADLEFGAALATVPLSIHLSSYEDETSQVCTWHVPRSHFLEAWGDGRSWTGLVSIQQPLIQPLYASSRSPVEFLAMLLPGKQMTDGYEIVRRTFAASLPAGEFERAWRGVLHDGVAPGSGFTTARVQAAPAAAQRIAAYQAAAGEFELVLVQDYKLYDGRYANNGWLQELPHPLTKITWDNAACIAPSTARRLGLDRGDMIEITAGGRTLHVPVFIMPGQNAGTIVVALGYGRTSAGYVGNGVGFDAYQVRTTGGMWIVPDVKVAATGREYELITTQDHFAIDLVGYRERERRVFGNLVRSATVDEYREAKASNHPIDFDDPHQAGPEVMHTPVMLSGEKRSAVGERRNVPLQLWEYPITFEGHAWGMAIDLNKCVGCSACVIACQAENNVPIVGKEQVKKNREMHWIRIDRYFSGDPEKPETMQAVHQPVTCHHCETAPCEQVCPVAATVHDTEGLNVMVYNRCVGTRYCSNNCPYKVRRFNWFDWHSKPVHGDMFSGTFLGLPDQQQLEMVEPVRRMGFNPDVTVRMRGIMEKCTFCVQRIKAATIPAKNDWTAGTREHWRVADGEITPACAQTCATEAIIFGDLNDPTSRVSRAYGDKRSYGMLKELNTRPRNRYMALVTNPSPSFADAAISSVEAAKEKFHHAPHGPETEHAPASGGDHAPGAAPKDHSPAKTHG